VGDHHVRARVDEAPRGEPSAEDILAARLARGEIDETEYKARRDALRSQH
jgi:uncharacterized membrane protein